MKAFKIYQISSNYYNQCCPEGVLGCSPPGKFRREKYQRGDQGKNRHKFTPPENFVEKKSQR